MSVLYVTQPGSELRKQGGRLQVLFRGELLRALPLREVERVALLAPIQVSAAATRALLQAGIPTLYYSQRGVYYGMLTPGGEDVERWLIQVQRWQDQDYRLILARSIVRVKVGHQRSVLRRQARNYSDSALTRAADDLTGVLRTLETRSSLDQIRGAEGWASAVYFGVLGRCIRQDGIEFRGRNRRPPRDPVNSLLSLGYMLLLGEITAALRSQGLQVGLGFLHEPSRRRQALALDLLEVFRQPVADRLALSLVNRTVLTGLDFVSQDTGGVRLTREGLQRYLAAYDRTLTRPLHTRGERPSATYRDVMRQQAGALRTSLEQGVEWVPTAWEL